MYAQKEEEVTGKLVVVISSLATFFVILALHGAI
ncbi:hypothetical protein Pan216_24190 [Planctomycetes bacterium Pan216]|uniref:Uncharacterized protein n=1 Tax=Kolteria novifilia TaxID=2527975 RepID=A0A518B3I4_9BACT|nr:hypothetical protein Pan216_24190 [Planctomycetes bacterium Pan216]